MAVLLRRANQVFSQEKASAIAAQLNADKDDNWTYVVVNNPDPNGSPKTAIIEVYDEDGFCMGSL